MVPFEDKYHCRTNKKNTNKNKCIVILNCYYFDKNKNLTPYSVILTLYFILIVFKFQSLNINRILNMKFSKWY